MFCGNCGTPAIASKTGKCAKCGEVLADAAQLAPGPPSLRRVSVIIAILGGIIAIAWYAVRSVHTGPLPEISDRAERIANRSNEYVDIVRRFGYPDSIETARPGTPAAAVQLRIAKYAKAHLAIAYAPVGCVGMFLDFPSAEDEERYPAVERDVESRLSRQVCTPSGSAWTVVGYKDLNDGQPVSAKTAGVFLSRVPKRTEAPPVH